MWYLCFERDDELFQFLDLQYLSFECDDELFQFLDLTPRLCHRVFFLPRVGRVEISKCLVQ